MNTRRQWTKAKQEAGLEMPARGKPNVGPTLDKFHKLKPGKDASKILDTLQKGFELYQSVDANKKNAKAKALLKSALIDLELAREAAVLEAGAAKESARKELEAAIDAEISKLDHQAVIKNKTLRRLFVDYASGPPEYSEDVVKSAVLCAAGKWEQAALKYGPNDDWNAGPEGRALTNHFNGTAVLPKSELSNHKESVVGGQVQMVWSSTTQSLFGRFKKTEGLREFYRSTKFKKLAKQLL